MKKFVLLLLATLIVGSLCLGAVAFASTPQEIATAVKKIDGVEDAKVALSNTVCFVAVKPCGVISKIQCEKLCPWCIRDRFRPCPRVL